MLKSIRARAAACLQVILAVCCVACVNAHVRAQSHPIGVAAALLRLAPSVSFLLLVWLAFEVASWRISPWKGFAALAVGLLALGITFIAAELLLVGE
jgi:hypothetical protein